jgi:hypothetical protein
MNIIQFLWQHYGYNFLGEIKMHEKYLDVVQKGLTAYQAYNYPGTSRSIFKIATAKLLVFLESRNEVYSKELAAEWLNEVDKELDRIKTVKYKRA